MIPLRVMVAVFAAYGAAYGVAVPDDWPFVAHMAVAPAGSMAVAAALILWQRLSREGNGSRS